MLGLLLIATGVGALVAYVNGANDVSKGIATLVGSGTTSYRGALAWGTFWTGLGALAGAWLAGAMLQTFGEGLFVPGTTPTFAAAIATMLGAGVWVLVATRTGLPVSTTHAIVGSLAGVALVAYGPQAVNWETLVQKIAVPLVASPLVALATVSLLIRASVRTPAPDCACVAIEPMPSVAMTGEEASAALASALPQVRFTVARSAECAANVPQALSLRIEHLHWVTSSATSFARALNDAPKIVALMLGASALAGGATQRREMLFFVVALGMVTGSIVGGRRVTAVLAERVTPMNHREGLLANATTAALVGAGAIFGLPMSTTHVASSAIIGIGVSRAGGQTNRRTVRDMLLAWLVTLPASALLGIAVFELALFAAGRAT
ncbi:MAG: inorganic phosphate transporter [Myxococcales bacterium]